jgi:hypothetical protein
MQSIDTFTGGRQWHQLGAVAAIVAAVASCGAPREQVEEVHGAAVAGQGVNCIVPGPIPPGYPQRANCHTGNKFGIATCTCYPADVTSRDTMAYQVVTILRAPPGNMSSITYSAGSTVGTVEQITNTNQFGQAYSLTGGVVDADGKWTVGSVSGTQNLLQTINTNTISLVQSANTPNQAYDTFYIWLNPVLLGRQSGISAAISASMSADSTMWSATGTLISSLGPDGQPRMQIEPISVNALANPGARTPSEHGFFDHLTTDQVNAILALDDFYADPSFDPSQHPEAYRYVTTLDLTGPEQGSPVIINSGSTIEYDSQNDPIDGNVNHEEVTIKAGGKFSFYGLVEFEAKFGVGWTWDYNDTRTHIQGVQKAANIILQSNTTCLHAWVDMYLDLAMGSWVAVPSFTNYSCAFYDGSTACTVGGVTMHCCPSGTAMVGLRADQNVFKCAPLANPNGAVTLDTGTVRNNMHVCPFGQVVVGLHADLNLLACQSIPGDPITSERVDSGTTDGWPMHVCDATFPTSAISGVRLDQNLLSCATNPNVF